MSRLSLAVLLLVVWVLLWGAASPANLLSGLAVIGVLFVVVPSTRRKWPSHAASPVGIVRLAASFATSMVTSNLILSWAILSPRTRVRTGVVRVPLTTPDVGIATMVTTAPLPKIPDATPTWAKAAQLTRQWELNALSERLEQLAS